MADEAREYDTEQGNLKRDAERKLLIAIAESAETFSAPDDLKSLAEAFALVIEHKAPNARGVRVA